MPKTDPFSSTPASIDHGRFWFGGAVLFVAARIVLSVIYRGASCDDWDRIKEAFDVVIPLLAGLVGSVIGFYFGKVGNEA